MIKQETIDWFREKFPQVHPLVMQRSVERARTHGELFDILSELPECPFVWSEETRRWVSTKDIFQAANFKKFN